MKRSKLLFTILLSAALLSAGSFFASDAAADDIVIYSFVSASRGQTFFETNGTDPGGTSRESHRGRSFVVLNKTTGMYRNIDYSSSRDHGARIVRRVYYPDTTDDSPVAWFETGPEDKRNYSVLSFKGTGDASNHVEYMDDPDAPYFRSELQTLTGRVRDRKIRMSLGTIIISCPPLFKGQGATEYQSGYFEMDTRYYEISKYSMRINARLTSAANELNAGTLDAGATVVHEYLESKGYENGGSGG